MREATSEVRPPALKWAAKVAPVKEVTLHGSADLAFWRESLRAEGLEPTPHNGRAQLFLSATETRFWGILFRECIIGIQVVRPARSGESVPERRGLPPTLPVGPEVQPTKPIAGLFLVQAWNSVRFFAWVERTIFKTPYRLGQIEVDPRFPARMHVSDRGESLIKATRLDQSPPESTAAEEWQGPIFLPRVGNGRQQLFFAQLNGQTEHYPFHADRDECIGSIFGPKDSSSPESVRPENSPDVFISAGFTPERWHIRQAASHSKSKTYRACDWYGD